MSTGTVPERRPSDVLRERRQEVLDYLHSQGIKDVRVFGSVARGDDSPSSDIDLLVVTPPKMGLRFARVYRELNELLGVPVDLVDQAGLRSQHRELIKDARPL
ncbi:nucleotidyltransferase family protein [Nesterenkonia alkaliphila]|uniref:Polymerase nucleotidyl transferase domain-containing protein n=1 Tax=Nesterenkonia alkaliphila TaxID=1463631 RepID=A0A7K1UFF2_9MICC|nr:nucleotidyltransferase family protein [Nesterenkonia alkaliphila]MVT25213.1 hypothetical protein [Nesterenkonia alkaliphila]